MITRQSMITPSRRVQFVRNVVPTALVQDVGIPLGSIIANGVGITVKLTVIVKTRVIVAWLRTLTRSMSTLLGTETLIRSVQVRSTKTFVVQQTIVPISSGQIDPKTFILQSKCSRRSS